MIRELYNLRCAKGHYHYSPNPKAWVGQVCSKPLDPHGQSSKKCGERMAVLRKK